MPDDHELKNLRDVLTRIKEETSGEEVTVAECLSAFDSRTHGPLLLLPGLVTVLPTGALPGVPHVMGGLVFLVSVQLLTTRRRIWLPERLRQFAFSRGTLARWVDRVMPWARRLEQWIHHRLDWFTGTPAQYAIALVCLALGPALVLLAMVPFGAFLPGLAIFLFGLGLVSRDGAIVLLAFLMSGATGAILVYVGNPLSG